MASVGNAVHDFRILGDCCLARATSARQQSPTFFCPSDPCRRTWTSQSGACHLIRPAEVHKWGTAVRKAQHTQIGTPARNVRQGNRVRAAVQTDAAPLKKTWSNPSGNILTEVVPGQVWAAERPFIWISAIDVGGKMGVVRLKDGSVWVHSPVPLDDELKAAIDALGPVKHIVTPNYEHAGFAQQWIDAYPDAKAYACPGLRAKKPDIKYSAAIGEGESGVPAEWGYEFSFAFFDCEHNPFTRKAFFNEVVYVHHPSGVLFVTDLFWNYPGREVPPSTFLWKQGMDKVYLPFYKAFMLKRKDKFDERLRTVLDWDFKVILPCHGNVVSENAHNVLRDHFQ